MDIAVEADHGGVEQRRQSEGGDSAALPRARSPGQSRCHSQLSGEVQSGEDDQIKKWFIYAMSPVLKTRVSTVNAVLVSAQFSLFCPVRFFSHIMQASLVFPLSRQGSTLAKLAFLMGQSTEFFLPLSGVELKVIVDHHTRSVCEQVASLQEERSTLIAETERLNERLNQADSLEDPR